MEIRRFLRKLGLFVILPGLLLASGLAALVAAGELSDVDRVIGLQMRGSEPVLYGPAYSFPEKYYKLTATLRRRPEVLALGTSRVWQVRDGLFRDDVRFYNAGGAARRTEHFLRFLERIPAGAEPSVIVVDLHQDYFTPFHDSVREDLDAEFSSPPSARKLFSANWRTALLDLAGEKYDLHHPRRKEDGVRRFGLHARVNGSGFRNDGSWDYGSHLGDPSTRRIYQEEIEQGTEHFHHGREPSALALADLGRFLDEAGRRGVQVVGFLPPFDHGTYATLWSRQEEFGYLRDLAPSLRRLFDARGFEFYDFSDPSSFGASDAEFIDELHGSEKVYARMWLRMLEEGSRLARYSDRDALEARLLRSSSDLTIFAATR
jgi:hypothetical protein